MKIPKSSLEITPEWLNDVLHSVSSGEITSIEIDKNFGPWSLLGKAVRVKINYAKKEVEPKSVIVKFQVSCSNPKREGEIYHLLSESKVPFIPKLFGVFGDGNLVLEDMTPTHSVDYNNFTIDQVRNVISILADVNGRFCEDSRVPKEDRSHFVNSININMKQGWDIFKDRYKNQLGKESADFEWMWKNAEIVSSQYNSGPTILSHGDVNRSNLLFPKDRSDKVILIDWQLSGHKVLSFDLSYFLVKVLTVEQRREYEDLLLKEYYDLLPEQIQNSFPFDRMVLHYRACVTRSMLSAVTRLGQKFDSQPKRFETADRLATRVIEAVRDLKPIEAIEELKKRR
ncbi:MAG: oxidoreductase family protein [Parcubacteria group bacterium]|jgi:hypothetical protein